MSSIIKSLINQEIVYTKAHPYLTGIGISLYLGSLFMEIVIKPLDAPSQRILFYQKFKVKQIAIIKAMQFATIFLFLNPFVSPRSLSEVFATYAFLVVPYAISVRAPLSTNPTIQLIGKYTSTGFFILVKVITNIAIGCFAVNRLKWQGGIIIGMMSFSLSAFTTYKRWKELEITPAVASCLNGKDS